MKNVKIPVSVTNISDNPFEKCINLISIIVDEENNIYDSRNNCNAIIKTNDNTLIAGCSNTIILEGITKIGKYAFYGCENLKEITIPNSVSVIENNAFDGCINLKEIVIPDGIYSIANNTFKNCTSLISIVLPNSIIKIGSNSFLSCDSLTYVYYKGTKEDWDCISIASGSYIYHGNICYYSKEKPNNENEYLVFWHYDEDGITPVIWIK